uniref:Uncharacterized protein n=1 Tax=Glossina palpalis gambiensis TaxID=67801 RepID=A0A1B0ALX3_9MUSC
MLELRDIDFGDISKSESERYRNDSRRCGRFCKTKPALGEPPSSGDLAVWPFSTSKLKVNKGKKQKTSISITLEKIILL